MRRDECRRRGMHIGLEMGDSVCKQAVGLRIKRPGCFRLISGANAVPEAPKCCVLNRRIPDFLHWRENQNVAA